MRFLSITTSALLLVLAGIEETMASTKNPFVAIPLTNTGGDIGLSDGENVVAAGSGKSKRMGLTVSALSGLGGLGRRSSVGKKGGASFFPQRDPSTPTLLAPSAAVVVSSASNPASKSEGEMREDFSQSFLAALEAAKSDGSKWESAKQIGMEFIGSKSGGTLLAARKAVIDTELEYAKTIPGMNSLTFRVRSNMLEEVKKSLEAILSNGEDLTAAVMAIEPIRKELTQKRAEYKAALERRVLASSVPDAEESRLIMTEFTQKWDTTKNAYSESLTDYMDPIKELKVQISTQTVDESEQSGKDALLGEIDEYLRLVEKFKNKREPLLRGRVTPTGEEIQDFEDQLGTAQLSESAKRIFGLAVTLARGNRKALEDLEALKDFSGIKTSEDLRQQMEAVEKVTIPTLGQIRSITLLSSRADLFKQLGKISRLSENSVAQLSSWDGPENPADVEVALRIAKSTQTLLEADRDGTIVGNSAVEIRSMDVPEGLNELRGQAADAVASRVAPRADA